MKKPQTHFGVLQHIFVNYVFKIKEMRRLSFLIVVMIVLSRYAEVVAIDYSDEIRRHFYEDDQQGQFISLSYFITVSFCFTFLYELSGYVFVKPIQWTYRNASKEFFTQYLSYDYVEFTKIGSGEIHSTIERKSKAISDIIEVTVLDILPIAITFLFVLYKILITISLFSAFIMAVSFALYLFATVLIAKERIKIREQVNKRINIQSNVLYDSLQNFESILAYCNRDLEVARYDKKLAETGVFYIKLYKVLYILNFLQKAIILLQIYFIILSGIYGIFMKKFNSKTYFIYIGLVRLLSSSAHKAGYLYSKYVTAIVNSMAEIPASNRYLGTTNLNFMRDIEIANLCITHGDKVILSNINFNIVKGDKVAIVGKNGAGKSSLIKVFLGFTEYSGTIYFDGVNMKHISIDSIRSKIGYIHQDSALFNDTVIYNILYGNVRARREEVVDVCKSIGVHDSILKLSDEYNTVVGERGMFLSGGEKQKVAFARVALKNADILLLDEPTASLDKEAEFELLEKLLIFYRHKTLLMIVHNLNLLHKFDKVIFINESTCKEIGSHEDLMGMKGDYYRFIMETTQMDG